MTLAAPVRLAALQMVSTPDVDANLATAARLIAQAADAGAQLVALPEYFPLISAQDSDKLQHAETDGHGPLQDFLRETAARHRIWLAGGTLPLRANAPGKVRNSLLVYTPEGHRAARYDKVHLFSYNNGRERYDESLAIEAGQEVVTFDSPLGRTGLATCYDLRFPEFFRRMGTPTLIILPAAFTYGTGQAHWEILLRARAIENQCFILAAAQGGKHPTGRRTWGQSMVIDPWGEILAQQAQGEGVILADCDPARLHQIRTALPALQHRVFA